MRNLLNQLFKKQLPQLVHNRQFLLKRQSDQLKLLEPLKSQVNNQLLDKSIPELLKINTEEVFNTFACRNLDLNFRSLNSLADVNIQRALGKNSKGVPFTVKDHLQVDGLIQTVGHSKNIKPSTQCSDIVKILQEQGCVAFAHSNVPQGLLGIQSNNPVYGPTKNPYNCKFIAGGSTGGQGAQIAYKASAFGVASDSAGSARIPAAFCGVYGYKPTGSRRLCVKGRVGVTGRQGPSIPGLDTSFGFITRSVEDLEWLCQKTLGKTRNYNPYVFGQWNQELYQKSKSSKKRFGVIYYNHQVQLAQSVKNTLNETVQMLRKQGHQVYEFDFPQLYRFRDFFFKVLRNVGFMNVMRKQVNGQKIVSQNQNLLNYWYSTKLGRALRVHFAKSQLEKEQLRIHDIGQSTFELTVILKQREVLMQKFYKQWNRNKIHLLLSPTMPFPALHHGATQHAIHQLTYTSFQNVLSLPAGHVPIRHVKPNQTKYEDTRLYGSSIRRSIQQSEGLPVGVQVTGEFMKDEVVLGGMWQLKQYFGIKLNPPTLV